MTQISGGISGSRASTEPCGLGPSGFDPGRIPRTGKRRNLLTLANYLESLPRGYRHFDMWSYADHAGDCELPMPPSVFAAKEPDAFLTNCGTVACAVGHGPAAGIRPRESEFWSATTFDWMSYADRAFTASGNVFLFLFGAHWKQTDNHHYGAAARIRFYLQNGLPVHMSKDPSASVVRAYVPYRKGSRSQIRRGIAAYMADIEQVDA